MFSDSCQAAKSIVDWAAGSIAESSLSACEQRLIEEGEDSDTAQRDCAQGDKTLTKLRELKNESFSQNTIPRTRVYGNAVWDALRFTSLTDDEKEIVQSLVGTFVCKMGEKGEPLCEYTGSTISLRDFLYGNQNAELIRNRTVSDETKPEVELIQSSIYPGYKQKVSNMITQIAEKVFNHASLSDDEKAFVDASVIPVISLIEITRTTPGLLESAVEMTSDIAALSMATSTVKRYIHAIESNVGKQSVVERDKLLDRIDSVKADLHNELTRELKLFEAQVRTFELTAFFLNQVSQKASPSVARAVKAKR
jgi:hypothetical protein